jgi:hypothetical protein
MKKLFTCIFLSAAISTLANAQTDKERFCPDLEQIKITRVQKPYTHVYTAYNNEHKYFVSKEYTEDDHNGPAPAISFARAEYDADSKTLSCVYRAFTRSENAEPTLVNVGDY